MTATERVRPLSREGRENAPSADVTVSQTTALRSSPPAVFPLRRTVTYIGASLLLFATQGLGMNFVSVNTYQI